jgi:hypothetical protein
LVEHIEGKKNFVADGITRVHRLQFAEIPASKRYLYEDDTIERVFRLTGESVPIGQEGSVEESDEDYEDLAPVGHIERHTLFRKYHNSMIGHFGVERTLKAMSKAGVEWRGMRQDVKSWIAECGVCQKIKHSRIADWEEEAEHHLYSCEPLKSISIDTAGPFPDEDDGFVYILAIVDNFSKYIRLYPTRNATAEEYVRCLVEWVSVFGVPKGVRTDGGPQFDSQLAEGIKSMLGFEHLIVVPYRPQANGIVERRMKEIKQHLQAIVIEKRIKHCWSRYLPLVQRIMNYSIDGSIGTQPARVIFGDLATDDLAMDLPPVYQNRTI